MNEIVGDQTALCGQQDLSEIHLYCPGVASVLLGGHPDSDRMGVGMEAPQESLVGLLVPGWHPQEDTMHRRSNRGS